MKRRVKDGEALSGHGQDGAGLDENGEPRYPEILISDGRGPGEGSLMCVIQCFHSAEVSIFTDTLETKQLMFEGRTCLSINGGIIEYEDGRDRRTKDELMEFLEAGPRTKPETVAFMGGAEAELEGDMELLPRIVERDGMLVLDECQEEVEPDMAAEAETTHEPIGGPK